MGDLRIFPLLFLLISWIVGGAYFYNQYCCASPATNDSNLIESASLILNANKVEVQAIRSIYQYEDYKINQPMSIEASKKINTYLDKLISDEKLNINILGYFGSKENNKSLFPNLGLARANDLKTLFTDNGILAKRVVLSSKKIDSDEVDKVCGLELSYLDKVPEKSSNDYRMFFNNNPIIIPYDSPNETISLTQEQRQKLFDLFDYMSMDKSVKIEISGLTKKTKNGIENKSIAFQKASFLRKQLVKNGIDIQRTSIKESEFEELLNSNNSKDKNLNKSRIEIAVAY